MIENCIELATYGCKGIDIKTHCINHKQIDMILIQPSHHCKYIDCPIRAQFGYEKDRKRIDKLWAAEAEDRLAAYETGELKSISAKEVFARIEKNKK